MVDDEPLVLRLNGRDVALAGLPPTATLLRAVRSRGLVGTKEGCGDGDCGACTVVLADRGPDGAVTHRAVNSCLVPVGSVVGLDVVTVEGVAGPDGGLHPVQQAVVDCAGSQCGYCTPGFVMSMFAGFHDPAERGPDGVDPAVVEGNLCRCTGYTSIRRACRRLGATDGGPDPTAAGAQVPAAGEDGGATVGPVAADRGPTAGTVTAAGRAFHRPTALADALALLAQHPDATVVAGGTDLGLELSHRTLDPEVVVSLEHVVELLQLERTPNQLQVGAGVSLTRLEREAAGLLPALDEMLHWFAARQVRNRATLGGNLGTASPIGDLPPVLLALDADVHLAGPDGPRTVAVADYFTGYRQTLRRPGEVVTRVDLPLGPGPGAAVRLSRSYKVGKRGTDDISVVAAAFTVDLAADGTVVHARFAYGGVAATPVRARAVEELLLGTRLDPGTVARAAARLAEAFTPLDDLRASAAYRRRLVGSLFEKFCAEHAPPAGSQEPVPGAVA
ncbi:xanthine dehydrogenase small subunit [Jannaschia sp. R86511]|uniref:xanthine dehydrogenase small subunit n=1 Tax=Jannaschia sp. R86511 TaxID=3093853 RepID=UPI0036D2B109